MSLTGIRIVLGLLFLLGALAITSISVVSYSKSLTFELGDSKEDILLHVSACDMRDKAHARQMKLRNDHQNERDAQAGAANLWGLAINVQFGKLMLFSQEGLPCQETNSVYCPKCGARDRPTNAIGPMCPICIANASTWQLGGLIKLSNIGPVSRFQRIVTIEIATPGLILLSLPIVTWLLFAPSKEWLLQRRRKQLGKCNFCGYDLQGCCSPRCPECGTPIPLSQAIPGVNSVSTNPVNERNTTVDPT